MITPSTDAIVYMVYLNCFKRWKAFYDFRYVEMKQTKLPTYSSKDPSTAKYKGKFSDNCGGQDKGGWSKEGLIKFNETVKKVLTNRKENQDHITEIDNQVLAILKKRHEDAEEAKIRASLDSSDEDYQEKLAAARRKRKNKTSRKRKRSEDAEEVDIVCDD